jgi:hypothetical protein
MGADIRHLVFLAKAEHALNNQLLFQQPLKPFNIKILKNLS